MKLVRECLIIFLSVFPAVQHVSEFKKITVRVM
jgi:hypothetical protein